MAVPANQHPWLRLIASQVQAQHSLFCSVMLRMGLCKTDFTDSLVSWLPGSFCQYEALERDWKVSGKRRDFRFPVSVGNQTNSHTRLVSVPSFSPQFQHQPPGASRDARSWATPSWQSNQEPAAAQPPQPGFSLLRSSPSTPGPSPNHLGLSSYLFPAASCSYYLWVTLAFPFCTFRFSIPVEPIPCVKSLLVEILGVIRVFLTDSAYKPHKETNI